MTSDYAPEAPRLANKNGAPRTVLNRVRRVS
jgi:hypothetical protein